MTEVSTFKSPVGGTHWKEKATIMSKKLSGSGRSLMKSLHFDHDLDEPLALVHKSSFAFNQSRLEDNRHDMSNHVGIQTEAEMEVEKSLGW